MVLYAEPIGYSVSMWRGAVFAFLSVQAAWGSAITPENLRCEFRSEPLGVDDPAPRFSWTLKSNHPSQNQVSYRIVVASSKTLIDQNKGDLWDSGTVRSREQNNIEYKGTPLQSARRYYWKVAVSAAEGKSVWSGAASWETGLGARDWKSQWIQGYGPTPLFRKEFRVRKPVERARLYITGLGYYEASLDGKRIGDHVLDPGWTRYDKRVLYSVYDVPLKPGDHCLGVALGNGWYNPLPLQLFGRFNLRDHLPVGHPRLIAELRVQYRDGSVDTIVTDQSWKVSDGPAQRNDIYLGEVYDARLEQPGWDRAGFDDSKWRAANLSETKLGPLTAQPQPPIRVTKTWSAVRVTEPEPGVFLYDMGVNFAGWASLRVELPAGTEIKLRYGELLYPNGSLNPMTSVAGQIKSKGVGGPGAPEIAWQTDTFIAKGGKETYTPKFTFHGFRYVEVTGLPKPLPLRAVTAMRLNSDVEDVGSFKCSNPLLEAIQAMCVRTFKSNIFSVQSDCPHRERLAYGGDIVATSEAFMANFDMATFYEKTVRDWSDSALSDGMFTDTAPFIGIHYCGLAWAMAHPLLIQQLYQYYGNRRLGAEEYGAAKRWLSLVESKYPEGIVTEGLSDHEGLLPAAAPEMVTPLYFLCARMMAKLAKRLGHMADARHFDQLAARIQAAYSARFIDEATGKVGPGTQASQSFALYTNIAPEATRNKVFDFLLQDIDRQGGKLTTGILGTKFMLEVLSQRGRSDLAYRIVTQPDFPGWAWMLKHGATTLWEHWQFSDNTFSHNHPMFGSVSQWMMQWLGGIRPHVDAVGYDRIVIQPQTPPGLDWVKSSYRSVRGLIVSDWKRDGEKTRFEVTIPPNTSAQVLLPNGAVVAQGKTKKIEGGGYAVGSGRFVFVVGR